MWRYYTAIRPVLFLVPPEHAHRLALHALATLYRCGWRGRQAGRGGGMTVMGLEFPNRVGLAAGLDKNGEFIDALGGLGCGFIEVGTVTPKPQPGNPQPRLFRLPQAQALINRMGFNNHGVAALVARIRARQYGGVLGVNLGKNRDTPIEQAAEDYVSGLRAVYPYADYVTVNISSPNTSHLRDLQSEDTLRGLLATLKGEQLRLHADQRRYVPLAVKIAPDLTEPQLAAIAAVVLAAGIDGVIATNTTVARDGVVGLAYAREAGGLSGAPLTRRATAVVKYLATAIDGRIPIIAAGGIMSAQDALDKLAAGASLVQLYTGLIYRGPGLVAEVIDAVADYAVS